MHTLFSAAIKFVAKHRMETQHNLCHVVYGLGEYNGPRHDRLLVRQFAQQIDNDLFGEEGTQGRVGRQLDGGEM